MQNLLRKGINFLVLILPLLYLWYQSLYYLLFVDISPFRCTQDEEGYNRSCCACIGWWIHSPIRGIHVTAQTPSELRSKKNHDRVAFVGDKKDQGKAVVLGSPTKRSKHPRYTPFIHLSKNIGNPLLPFPHVLVGWMSQTVAEIKDCVSTEDYAHMRKLSKTGKSGLLAESAFLLLRSASLVT